MTTSEPPVEGPGQQSRSGRAETDESLRVEREKADQALEEELTAVDETADAVISRARALADDVLAAARAKTDQRSTTVPPAHGPKIVERERVLEDKTIREERADADEVLREERAEQAELLLVKREETDRDLISERARSDDALAMRDEFLGVVSHDQRNILTGIVGYAGLIAQRVSREEHMEEVLRHAQRIQRLGARMNRLIGDLLDVASIDAGKLAVTREVGDPTHVVTESVDTFQVQALAGGISLAAEIVRPLPLAAFDPARILQVLTNLLSNALKFTPATGTVTVRLERVADEIRIAVRDTGVGIPANKLEAVFERFLQVTANDRRGAGLGLYISRCIVEGHGGRIWAESTIGQGSTFCFTLPIHVPG